ncbi:uncharacterized protein [Nicotiana tomentosiformis]|uniref:uncharacterized protein n=1 Tax=Nicotiana tomentosiformis TaxID=4098 RepID=UPI00388C8AC0
MLTRPAGSPALTWDQFSQLFLEKFIPITLREGYRRLFKSLQQGSMTVTQYETRFVDLTRHVNILLPTERERVRRFIDGLTTLSGYRWPRKPKVIFLSRRSVDIVRWIEMVRSRKRVPVSDKRARHFGGFSGASYGGRGSFGIIPDCHRDASVLFDLGSIYSYVSSHFASYLIVPCDSLSALVYVSTYVGDSIVVNRVYRLCVVSIRSLESSVDLLLLDMVDIDVILGMDWLSSYHAILDCHAKMARQMVEKACLAYLAYVRDSSAKVPSMDSVPVVRQCPEVYPVDLPGMPPDRDIDF